MGVAARPAPAGPGAGVTRRTLEHWGLMLAAAVAVFRIVALETWVVRTRRWRA